MAIFPAYAPLEVEMMLFHVALGSEECLVRSWNVPGVREHGTKRSAQGERWEGSNPGVKWICWTRICTFWKLPSVGWFISMTSGNSLYLYFILQLLFCCCAELYVTSKDSNCCDVWYFVRNLKCNYNAVRNIIKTDNNIFFHQEYSSILPTNCSLRLSSWIIVMFCITPTLFRCSLSDWIHIQIIKTVLLPKGGYNVWAESLVLSKFRSIMELLFPLCNFILVFLKSGKTHFFPPGVLKSFLKSLISDSSTDSATTLESRMSTEIFFVLHLEKSEN